ncbi:MAG: hypothetical protein MUC83_07330 [Pirellula sp.]|nr:hypothetical protein [Pirellula sp.]
MSLVEQRDFILLAMGNPFSLGPDYWQEVAGQLESRLGVTVGLCTDITDCSIDFWNGFWIDLARRKTTRLLVTTVNQRNAVLQSMRDAIAWQTTTGGEEIPNRELGIQFSKGWDEVDWAEVLAGSPLAYSHSWRLTTKAVESSRLSEYSSQRQTISGIVWEMRRLGLDADYIILDNRYEPVYPVGPCVKLPWCWPSSEDVPASDRESSQELEILGGAQPQFVSFAEIVPPEAWVHVIVKKYLEGIKHCVPQQEVLNDRSGSPLEQIEPWRSGYGELLFRMEELLPSEYRGKADGVSSNSMGSARIEVGADGKVPWDKIWTSFCDLALAGGPPHRGKLLEAVTSEECASDPDRYESVVAEIERGIQMVTGLKTVRSDSLGWVGVECDDQQMAAWLMRAIIVENVMVRRQAHVLYLPAGPEFQLTKEIKNVITSVAKTVHYWRDH